ncbi:MAG: beta-lactamase family protein, partial [Planctomycetaceae bacterium]|nr:beta-lactamase family protein [Planctomycetaceae bacterium]
MKRILLLLLAFTSITVGSIAADETKIYPSSDWTKVAPEKYGYDAGKLEQARKYIVNDMKTMGLMVVVGGESIFEYGSLTRISYIASCRKSVLAMLYGKYVENGTIDLSRTMADLGIDDIGGLLPLEKQATIKDLITARSGVYHDASNSGDDAARRPPRGSKKPGEYYLYNNWDFNAAGAVFEQLTGKNIYKVFKDDIGIPIGVQDYDLANQKKGGNLSVSKFPAYHFYFSTRDMARIGYLMLRKGQWNGKQVISAPWVKTITTAVTPKNQMNPINPERDLHEYGYMWWLFNVDDCPALKGAYTARGSKGQYITVIPKLDMVVAHKTDP